VQRVPLINQFYLFHITQKRYQKYTNHPTTPQRHQPQTETHPLYTCHNACMYRYVWSLSTVIITHTPTTRYRQGVITRHDSRGCPIQGFCVKVFFGIFAEVLRRVSPLCGTAAAAAAACSRPVHASHRCPVPSDAARPQCSRSRRWRVSVRRMVRGVPQEHPCLRQLPVKTVSLACPVNQNPHTPPPPVSRRHRHSRPPIKAGLKMGEKRIRNELDGLNRNPVPNCSVGQSGDNVFKWDVNIRTPEGSLYRGGVFLFTITFPEQCAPTPCPVRCIWLFQN